MNLQREATLIIFKRIYAFIWKAVDGKAPAVPVVELLRDITEGYITYTHFLVKRRLKQWLKRRYEGMLDAEGYAGEKAVDALEFSLYGVLLGTATDQELNDIKLPHKWQSAEKKYAAIEAGFTALKGCNSTIHSPIKKVDYEIFPEAIK